MAAKKKAKKAAPKSKKKAAPRGKKKVAPKKTAAKKTAAKKTAAKKTAAKKPAARKKAAPAKKAAARRPKTAAGSVPAGSTGRFVWHELATKDPAQAASFYTQLFGWTTTDSDMGPGGKYTMFKAGETAIGGIQPLDPNDPMPNHWHAYCTVPEVDAAVAKAGELGGKVLVPPMDIPTVGRFAVVQDPQGAILMPFKEENEASESGMPAPGMFCWDELVTSDPAAAASFYSGIYGWGIQEQDMGPIGTYRVLMRGGQMAGGIMGLPMPGVPPHWGTHVAVTNVEESLAKAESLGAKALHPITPVPGMGRFTTIIDPQGATIAMFQGDAPQ